MVTTPTLHLDNPTLKSVPDMTGLFKSIDKTVDSTTDDIIKYRDEIKKKNEAELLRLGNIKIDDNNLNAKVANQDLLDKHINYIHKVYQDAGTNPLGIPKVGAKERLMIQSETNELKHKMAFNTQVGDQLDELQKHPEGINYESSKAIGLTALKNGRYPIDKGFDEKGNPVDLQIPVGSDADGNVQMGANPDVVSVINPNSPNPLRIYNPINAIKLGKDIGADTTPNKTTSNISTKEGDIVTLDKQTTIVKGNPNKVASQYYKEFLNRGEDVGASIHQALNEAKANPQEYSNWKQEFENIQTKDPNTLTDDEKIYKSIPNENAFIAAKVYAKQWVKSQNESTTGEKPYDNLGQQISNAQAKEGAKKVSINTKTTEVKEGGFAYNSHALKDMNVTGSGSGIDPITGQEIDLTGKKLTGTEVTQNGLMGVTTNVPKFDRINNNLNFKIGSTSLGDKGNSKVYDANQNKPVTVKELQSRLNNEADPQKYLDNVFGIDKATGKPADVNLKIESKGTQPKKYFVPAFDYEMDDVLGVLNIQKPDNWTLDNAFNSIKSKSDEKPPKEVKQESSIDSPPKEISATQDQLDAQAKKKGMTSEKYLEFVKKQGYKVTIQ